MLSRPNVCLTLRAVTRLSSSSSSSSPSSSSSTKVHYNPLDLSALVISPHLTSSPSSSSPYNFNDGPSLPQQQQNETIAKSRRVISDISTHTSKIKGLLLRGSRTDTVAFSKKTGTGTPLSSKKEKKRAARKVAYDLVKTREKLKGEVRLPWSVSHSADQKPDIEDHTVSIPDDDLRSRETSEVRPLRKNLPKYSRRIEGLLRDGEQPVLQDLKPDSKHNPIARLSHGLDRVLFNPGVHWLQDPHSRVYNFDPYLQRIPNVHSFAFERLAPFTPSSRDQDLWSLAKKEDRTFAGSTSSLSGMLGHIYFLISGDKKVDIDTLSMIFRKEHRTFTPGQRMPSSVVFKHKDGVYAIDSDKDAPGVAERNILIWMGTLLEKFLTNTPADFSALLRSTPVEKGEEEEGGEPTREAYRYSKSERFVMRSQLDCVDNRLPGTGVFDIKTRAALPIRLDILNHKENSGYLIRTQHGLLESFEKEYYDLIRSAFLKYSFQVRIGNMDGVLVAYHNTARVFGFQYITLDEMERRLYGGPGRGDGVFAKCVGLLEAVCDEVMRCFPDQTFKCTFETLEGAGTMRVWVQPAEWTGEEDERPIERIDVTVTNYLGDTEVRGPDAIAEHVSPDMGEWTVHYAIQRSSLPHSELLRSFQKAKDRQFRAYVLPTGVSMEDMEGIWKTGMNYGEPAPAPAPVLPDVASESTPETGSETFIAVAEAPTTAEEGSEAIVKEDLEFDEGLFMEPTKNMRTLRKLAREGRKETQEREEEDVKMGRRKIVWGQPEGVYPIVEEEGRCADGEEGQVVEGVEGVEVGLGDEVPVDEVREDVVGEDGHGELEVPDAQLVDEALQEEEDENSSPPPAPAKDSQPTSISSPSSDSPQTPIDIGDEEVATPAPAVDASSNVVNPSCQAGNIDESEQSINTSSR